MKKLLFIPILLITLAGYSQSLLCLNGYSQPDAVTMRVNFLATGNKIRKPTSVWFNKDIVGKMLTLLKNEKTPSGAGADGIRIYFGTNEANQNTVLLVSTYAFGTDDSVPSGTFHQDYFNHADDILFHSSGINGEINNDTDSKNGAKLYEPCGQDCPDDAGCKDSRDFHYITRVYGEGMVKTFGGADNGIIGTNCEWFDLGLLSEIDSEMRLNHPDDYDGLRIYFGRHGYYDYFSPNKDAFVIEATTKSTDPSIHIDYFNCNAAKGYFSKFNKSYKNMLTITNLYLGKFLNQFLSKHDSDKKFNNITVYNLVQALISNGVENGEICPTHCPGTSL
jgi:hypothetical protein